MHRNTTNFQTTLIFSLLILGLTGLLQAEISSFFSMNLSSDYLSIYAGATYLFSLLTPFAVLVFFLMTVYYMSIIFGVQPKVTTIAEVIGFSFIPFFLNSVVLFFLLLLTPNIENQITNMLMGTQQDFNFTTHIRFSMFKWTGNSAAFLFVVLFIYGLAKRTNLSLVKSSLTVLIPPLLVYLIRIVFL